MRVEGEAGGGGQWSWRGDHPGTSGPSAAAQDRSELVFCTLILIEDGNLLFCHCRGRRGWWYTLEEFRALFIDPSIHF